MKRMIRRAWHLPMPKPLSALVFAMASMLAMPASAQWSPTKPMRIIVPFPAGGIVDLMARTVSDKLAAGLGQPVVVEAKPGAMGSIGTDAGAKADADGHTITLATLSHVTLPAFMNLPWHPTRDFAGIGVLGQAPNVVVVAPGLEPKSLREFIDYAKARPGQINFPNAGNGTSQTLGIYLLMKNTGVQMVSVGYKGYPQVIPDIISGQIQFALVPLGVAGPQIRAGKLRPLAMVTPTRLRTFPDVPTMAEAGYPESPVISWYAFVAPKATPKAAIDRINAELAKALAEPDVQTRMETAGGLPMPVGTPAELDAMLAREVDRWSRFVKETGLKIE